MLELTEVEAVAEKETLAVLLNNLEEKSAVEALSDELLSDENKPLYGKMCGEPILTLPQDLYIPPDAMEVILEVFEGPLDLLLYLIKKNNIDILNIPVAVITHQYIEYMNVMTIFRLELAADYLEMAAFLTEIKSRLLLPKSGNANEEECDPRAELVRRLQEYERYKQAAIQLDTIPRIGRDIFFVKAAAEHIEKIKIHPHVELKEVLLAFKDVLKRADLKAHHTIQKEGLSVREKMSEILSRLTGEKFVEFVSFFNIEEGRLGVVVTFLAILELSRENMIELTQNENFGPIYVRVPECQEN